MVSTVPPAARRGRPRRLLAMEFVPGARATDGAFFREHGIVPAKVSLAILEAFAECIFLHGYARRGAVSVRSTSPFLDAR